MPGARGLHRGEKFWDDATLGPARQVLIDDVLLARVHGGIEHVNRSVIHFNYSD